MQEESLWEPKPETSKWPGMVTPRKGDPKKMMPRKGHLGEVRSGPHIAKSTWKRGREYSSPREGKVQGLWDESEHDTFKERKYGRYTGAQRDRGCMAQDQGKKLGSLMDLRFPIHKIKMVLPSSVYTTEKLWGSSERIALWLRYLYSSINWDPTRQQAFSLQ